MANIIEFPIQKPQSGLKRVSKSSRVQLKRTNQLDLFSQKSPETNIFVMPSSLSPFEEALMLDEKGDSGAKEAYQNAVNMEDCTADAYCNLGILEYESGSTIKAIDCFTKSLKTEPRHFESHYNLANLYSELGNLPLAKTHYEFARELQPDFPDICFNLGLVYAMTRDFESALRILSEYKEMVTPEESENADKLIESIKKLTG
ncbi:MAG: tetratricopeptide repeat protein [Chlorobi bacterium]|nr:tetratricopeptide repeat protein [Chlorobiota bacterium]MCI0715497.1 tetratricopeptide repeat protein [Chlorobiota bacterium]